MRNPFAKSIRKKDGIGHMHFTCKELKIESVEENDIEVRIIKVIFIQMISKGVTKRTGKKFPAAELV